ncbi:hypothetical protein QR680_010438 [Steinernema hermaphroditum]|uniref:F-box domain-containing protein n=1 Tax=Steinernema hermaphroditum TaxID=289476 RepID=A0AA39IQ72_9BILA|nr:hypothetical protein QR680_010438 [Steinernema hermaphroditum]
MDSVPYAFCEDVLERLSKENLDTMTELSGQWKTVVQRFIEKRRTFNITISKDSEGWFYGVEDATDETKTRKIEIDEHSHEEFLSMDRRYVEINQISIYSDLDQSDFEELDPDLPLFQCSSELRCSKEEMARRVVPFLTLQMRPYSSLVFSVGCPWEITVECHDMFRRCFTFGKLELVCRGAKSEEFLALQLKNNPFLGDLTLRCWEHTETTEQLLLTFLNSRKKRALDIFESLEESLEDELSLKVTIEIVKAAVDSWVRGDEKRYLSVSGNIGVTPAEILSIPMPENVTRREEEGDEEGDFCVRWTKEDGSNLLCELYFSHDLTVIESSAGRFATPYY